MAAVADRYDVIVVGARCSGSTLAALLGRAGLRVLAVDQARFPSDTLSTHVIFDDSFTVWEQAGAWPRVQGIGAVEMPWIDWRRTAPSTDLSGNVLGVSGRNYTLGLRRVLLDQALLENALETPGVTVLTSTKATEVLFEDGRVAGLAYERERGRRETARAPLVVGADGRFSLVARAAGAPAYNVVPAVNFPFYTYLTGVIPQEPPVFELYESPQSGMIMVTHCEGDVFMAVVYTPQAQWEEFRKDHERLFWERLRAEPRIWPRLEGAEAIAPIRGRGDMTNFLRVCGGPGWALVGDSGQFKDPIFGQGIGDASRSCALLAEQILRAAGGEVGWDEAMALYHAYRDADILPRFDMMIRRRPHGVDPDDFEVFAREVGRSPEWSGRYLNVFTHAVPLNSVFNADAMARFQAEVLGAPAAMQVAS